MAASNDRSIPELVSDLTQNLRALIRQELALARAELTQSVSNARRSAMLMAVGGALAWMGGLAIVAALCLGLQALGLPPVAAAAIVGVVLAVVGYALLRTGLSGLSAERVAPTATMETLKDNAQLLKGQLR